MIEVINLSKNYGSKKAVQNINFNIKKGEIVGFLGPNGAGKSTTMNIICGYIAASGGNAIINGHDILAEPLEAKKSIGYLPEQPPLYPDMTVDEYLSFVYDLKKVKLNKREHLEEIKSLVKISDVSKRIIKNLSKGYKQRVGLAQALVGNPEVLILDEPTVGLDPRQIIEMRNLIKKLGKERTIILSSHILQEISAVCERIIIINEGRIVAEGTADELTYNVSESNKFVLRIRGSKTQVLSVLKSIKGIRYASTKSTALDGVTEYSIECDSDLREEIFYAMAREHCPILMLKSADLTLEEVFVKITSRKSVFEEEQVPENVPASETDNAEREGEE